MRLIDADELKEQFAWSEVCRLSIKEITKIINDAPTINPIETQSHLCGDCLHLIFKDYKHHDGECRLTRLHRNFEDICVNEDIAENDRIRNE